MSEHYFARFGKVYGPYTESEVTALQAEGKLATYTWAWDAKHESWVPLDAAPPPLPKRSVRAQEPASDMEAVCHNFQNFVSGNLELVTETGCEFVSGAGDAYPVFGEASCVRLNVLDSASGQLQNVQARVCAVLREGEGWKYRLRWEHRPDFS